MEADIKNLYQKPDHKLEGHRAEQARAIEETDLKIQAT